jgi:DUF1365 family protein
MGLGMRYHWRIRAPKEEALIHIESHPVSGESKLFDATLALRRAPLSRKGWRRCWPLALDDLKVLLGIYWQALRFYQTHPRLHPSGEPPVTPTHPFNSSGVVSSPVRVHPNRTTPLLTHSESR